MKRIRFYSLLLSLVLCLTACGLSTVTLQDPIPIPEDGVISARLLSQIRDENAIAVFEGSSAGLAYEWTIFGSDLDQIKTVDLGVELQPRPDSLQITFAQMEPFGFPALLSVHLAEKWQADGAGAWQDGRAVSSVSLTGTDATIVNLPVGDTLGTLLVLPETIPAAPSEQALPAAPATPEPPSPSDDYLSSANSTDSQVHGTQPAPAPQDEPAAPSVRPDGYLTQGQTGSDAVYGTTQSQTAPSTTPTAPIQPDGYLSGTSTGSDRVYSTTTGGGKDRYHTDPVPAGKPLPAEPQDQQVDTRKRYTCTFSIECAAILNNLPDLAPEKRSLVPSDGVILKGQTVTFYEGESVFDVLQRLCRDKSIHMESSWTPIYNSAYIEGIGNLYEFDCGALSGWMYRVNGWYPNYGCSRYLLKQGDVVEWRYTCDLGKDVGGKNDW